MIPYIKQIRFVFKGLTLIVRETWEAVNVEGRTNFKNSEHPNGVSAVDSSVGRPKEDTKAFSKFCY
jgi:hypothetical protein